MMDPPVEDLSLVAANEPCPICMEAIPTDVNNATTCCGHKFCFTCVATMLFQKMTLCPYCRASMIPRRAPRSPLAAPRATGLVIFPPPAQPGEYEVAAKIRYTERNIRSMFEDNRASMHPTIWSSAWPAETRPNYTDIQNFIKLFRVFDFPTNFRSTITTLHTEFKSWRRFEHARNPSPMRSIITANEFESTINRLGVMYNPERGKTILLGNCRGGYNVFIQGSIIYSDTNMVIGRVLVDPPTTDIL